MAVKGVRFGYETLEPVLRNVSFQAAPGERIAIHGKEAAGKSTLLDILYGLRSPEAGTVELDGTDYRHLSLRSLRDHVMLIRGTEIFPGTVFENVALGSDAGPSQVRQALEQSGVWGAVAALPQGLDTRLAVSGRPLSPSQSLRLVLARGILQRPRLLLIDEALDAISDLRTGGALVTTLFGADAPWTLILATERAELWPLCDHVYLLDGGELREESAVTATATQAESGGRRGAGS